MILVGLFLLAVLLQAGFIYLAHTPEIRPLRGDEGRYHMRAVQIASGHFPAQDFVWPPLYDFFLGAIYAVFGTRRIAVELIQTLLFLLSGYLFFRLIVFAGMGSVPACVGTSFFLLDPQIASFAQYLWPEILHMFLLLLMLTGFFLHSPRRRPAGLLLAGLSAGAAVLTKSLIMPLLPLLVFLAVARAADRSATSRWKAGLSFALGVAVLVLPLVAYNGVRHGFWGVADSATFNVWLGLKGDQYAAKEFTRYQRLSREPAERNRLLRDRIQQRIQQNGIMETLWTQAGRQYFRLFNRDSVLIEQLPGGRWAGDRASAGWLTTPLKWWSYIIYGFALFLGSLGMFQIRSRTDINRCLLPAVFLAYNLGLFLLLYARARYRIPFLPVFYFFSAVFAFHLNERHKEVGLAFDWRLFAGVTLGLLFLCLAFADAPA